MVTDRTNQSPVPLVHRDPSDLGSQILIRILPKEHNLGCKNEGPWDILPARLRQI